MKMTKKSSFFMLTACALFFISMNISWAENIVIKGSTTVLPIAQKLSEAYRKQNPDINISISGGGSGSRQSMPLASTACVSTTLGTHTQPL